MKAHPYNYFNCRNFMEAPPLHPPSSPPSSPPSRWFLHHLATAMAARDAWMTSIHPKYDRCMLVLPWNYVLACTVNMAKTLKINHVNIVINVKTGKIAKYLMRPKVRLPNNFLRWQVNFKRSHDNYMRSPNNFLRLYVTWMRSLNSFLR